MDANSYKAKILSRYCGHYQRAASLSESTCTKTSEDIMMDLRPAVDLNVNEISEYMMDREYVLEMEDGRPVWLMKEVEMLTLGE